jgi:ribosomal protein S18 acetylase RimI-like enzyme
LKIRRATQNDLETVRELWEALYEECPEPEHERKDWEEVADDVRRAIEAHVTLLAEQDGEAVGFLLGRPKSERIGYVSDLYVLPEHRTRGIARELLTEAVAALGREVVTLDVDVTNAAAHSFYRRLGFHEQSLRLAIEAERLA